MQYYATGTPMLAPSGSVAQVNRPFCNGCGICEAFCQFDAITVWNGYAEIDAERCMGCAVCESKCARGAISMIRMESRGLPLDTSALVARVRAEGLEPDGHDRFS
jgi:MinD superfamily P-loop ATPase